jgi:ribosome biogenesis GTPase / thiamine phosphate phosphatase
MDEKELGIVMATRGRRFEVLGADHSRIQCEVLKKVKFDTELETPVAVGDRVEFMRSGDGSGAIEKVLERRTCFMRPEVDTHGRKQVIAANLDQLVIVSAVKSPKLKTGLIDRFIVAAQIGSLAPVVVINKADLAKKGETDEYIAAYNSIGIPTFLVSAEHGTNLDILRAQLSGKLSLFAGHSGVGKSTLLNSLIPDLNIRTHIVSAYTDKGQHTTTAIELYELAGGGLIADSPGLKVMGIWDTTAEDLPHYFQEFRALSGDCKFQPCSHIHEPKCAVKKALEDGKIFRFRYDNYLAISESLGEDEN